jgi:hypothetical protein
MQKFVEEPFVQHLGVCKQYLQASKQTNKQAIKQAHMWHVTCSVQGSSHASTKIFASLYI